MIARGDVQKKEHQMCGFKWGGVATALAVTCLVAAGVAGARVVTASKSTSVPQQTNGSVAARCARGSEAVSGGFANPGFDPTGPGPAISTFSSKRIGGRTWKVSARNSGGDRGTLTSFAYCDTNQPGLKAASKAKVIDPDVLDSVTARCPSGSEAVSGGFTTPEFDKAGAAVVTFASKRVSKRSWKASGFNAGADPGTLEAFAYCDKHEPGLTTKSRDADIGSGETGSTSPRCPRGRKAVAGGFDGHVEQTMGVDAGALSFSSKRVRSREWKTSALADGVDSTLTGFAYCKT